MELNRTAQITMFPLTGTSVAALTIFTAVFAYGDLMWPLVVNSDLKMIAGHGAEQDRADHPEKDHQSGVPVEVAKGQGGDSLLEVIQHPLGGEDGAPCSSCA